MELALQHLRKAMERGNLMPRPIRTPYLAKPVHDRRSTDLTRLAEVAAIEIDDPMGLEPGDKIVTLRSIRNDPLARLHAHRQINEAQYQGGRAFQDDFENAGRGPQAMDPTKEHVDGGLPPEPLGKQQQEALGRLNRAHRVLGHDGSIIAQRVLIDGWTCKQIASERERKGRKWEEFYGTLLQEVLTTLAVIYNFAMKARA
jgi:hypothetical protein